MSMLYNGVSGLNASSAGLQVVSQNVANAKVAGYSRQTVVLQTSDGALNGVKITKIERIVDGFLNDDIWRTKSDLSYYESYQDYLGYMEEVLGTDSLNLNDAVAKLNSAFNAALSSPESPAYRQQVISTASAMVQNLQQLNGAMTGQVEKLGFELTALSGNTNTVLAQVAELNEKITKATALGHDTSVLMDNREQAIIELSGYIQVDVTNQPDGSLNVTTLNGSPLVMAGKAATLSVAGTTVTLNFNNQTFSIPAGVGGSLGGLLKVNADVLAPSRLELNTLVAGIADAVNGQLVLGRDLNGNAGAPLFVYNAADPLGSIEVNSTITPEQLAFRGAVGGVGDNSNLINVINALKGTAGGYDTLIGKLAIQSKQVQASIKTSQVLNDKALAARASVSGVSLDEEAANLTYYRQLYEANAKVISTADQMFMTLMAMF